MVGNGATVHALVRGGAIAALGHAVRLVTLGPVLPYSGIEVCTRPLPKTPWEGLRAFRSFQRDLSEFRPDLLHVHYAGGRLGSLALASGIKPLVVTVMGGDVQPEQHMGQLRALDHRTTRRLLEEADLILAKSTALGREIAGYGDYAEKTETVRWGIDTSRFARDEARGLAMRRKLGLPEGPILLSPRILRPLYNIHLILEAMPEILAARPDVLLLISRHREDVEYADKIRLRVSELGVGRSVRFIEPIGYADMPDLLSATSVVVSVPFSDGLPQTLFESLASETPIVLGRLAAYEEMVQPEREVLMSDLSAPAIARAVSRLLADDHLARRLRQAGLKRVREAASLPDEARRVEAMYRRILAGPRRSSPLAPRVLDAMSLAFGRA
jgi:glycosyltransferase involved in cell wall biosynthesis